MANTFVHIATVTVGNIGSTSMEFANIPQNFTDLVIKISPRGMGYWLNDMRIRFNNSNTAGTEYDSRWLVNNYGSIASSNYLNTMGLNLYYPVPGQSYLMSERTFGSFEVYIPNYTGNKNKSCFVEFVGENGEPSYNVYQYQGFLSGAWKNTSAITSINLDGPRAWANFRLGNYTSASLYGINKS